MNLSDIQKNWDQFGKDDPYWAILTDPNKKGNKWEEEDFFKTGRNRIAQVVKKLKKLNPEFIFQSALDFGCGVGRLTLGLANHFDKVVGIDIAPSMIKIANEKNNKENCTYFLNEKNDLSIFKSKSFDLVYSEITLQHMQPQFAKNYIAEFFRILKPNGLAIFQIPSKLDLGTLLYHTELMKLYRKVRRIFISTSDKNTPIMEMYCIAYADMVPFLVKNGGKILQANKINNTGDKIESYLYIVSKK